VDNFYLTSLSLIYLLEGLLNQTNPLIIKSAGLINQAPTLKENETFSKRNTYLINEFSLEIFIFCDNYKYQQTEGE
jgi:hypothetical protein